MCSEELGTLIVVILKARNLIDKHSFYKQDVFCQAALNGKNQKSEVDVKGGQHPVWDTELRFPVMKDGSDKHRKLEISCWSKESRSDEILGTGKVDITETLKTGEFDDWVPLDIEGVQRGDVYLEMTYFSNAPAPAVKVTKPVAAPQTHSPLPPHIQPLNLQRRPSKWKPSERLARPASYYQVPSQLKPSGRPNGAPPPGHGGPLLNPHSLPSGSHSPPSSRSSSNSPTHKSDSLPPIPNETPARVPTILRPGPKHSPNAHPFSSGAPSAYPNPYDDAPRKQSLPSPYEDAPQQSHRRQASGNASLAPSIAPPESRPNPYDDPSHHRRQSSGQLPSIPGGSPPQSHTPNPLWADHHEHNPSALPPSFPLPNVTIAPASPAPTQGPGPSPTPTPYNYYQPLPPNPNYAPPQQQFAPQQFQSPQQQYPPPSQPQHPPQQHQYSPQPQQQYQQPHNTQQYPPGQQNYPQQPYSAPYGQPSYTPAPYAPHYHQSPPPPERNNLPDPYLIARYQTPLPLPPGASPASPTTEAPAWAPISQQSPPRSPPRQPSPPCRQPSPPRRQPSPPRRQPSPPEADPHLAALRAEEERAVRRREQELRDMELARKLDMELNLSPVDTDDRRTGSSGPSLPGAW